MGWTYTLSITTRVDMVADLRRQLTQVDGQTIVRDATIGNHYWAVIERDGERTIFLALMQGRRRDGWGYKDMSESCGPFYYDCPLAFLELAPSVPNENGATWREKVRYYHEAKRARPKLASGLTVEYGGHRYTLDRAAGPRRGWLVTRNDGLRFRMTLRQLAAATLAGQA